MDYRKDGVAPENTGRIPEEAAAGEEQSLRHTISELLAMRQRLEQLGEIAAETETSLSAPAVSPQPVHSAAAVPPRHAQIMGAHTAQEPIHAPEIRAERVERISKTGDSTSGGAPSQPLFYGENRGNKPRRAGKIILFMLSCILVLTLGAGSMFLYIYAGVPGFLNDLIKDTGGDHIGIPYDVPDDADIPDADGGGDENEVPAFIETPVREFVPIENPPLLKLVPVGSDDGEARDILEISDIAERGKPSVVGVIKYVGPTPQDGYTIGSGIIFTEDGYIITNTHVILNPFSITVLLSDGAEYSAEVVSFDEDADIAILKIEAAGLTPAEFGDSAALRVGDVAVAIGCPASIDLQGTTTAGIISALDRVITVDSSGRTMRLLQTDAAINPGNSGGPLLNKYGQVIGVNTIKMTSTTYEGLCFAIPSGELERIVQDLFAYGYVRGFPAIGITANSVLSAEGAPAGVLVATTDRLGGAYGKILPGDIITHCNGSEVYAVSQINTIKNRLKVGDTITLTVYRDGETFNVDITLVDQYDLSND